jgi:hypothetical protein
MSGLNLEGMPIGVGSSGIQSLEERFATAGFVEQKLQELGFTPWMKPPFPCPQLDPNQDLANADFTSKMYIELLAWYSYTSDLLAKVLMPIPDYEAIIKTLSAEIRENYRKLEKVGEKLTAAEMADKILINPQYQNCCRTLRQFESYKVFLEKREATIRSAMNVVSRHITIRGQDIQFSNLETNIPNRLEPVRNRFGR